MDYSSEGRCVLGKTVPEVLDTAQGHRPRAVLKTDRPRLVNNILPNHVVTFYVLRFKVEYGERREG